ncbi:MAG: ATP-binding cassette domain-containing protein [Azospirillaceae bacterium]
MDAGNGGAGGGEGRLHATDISVSFDGIQALRDVSIEIVRGQVLGLIGPNGAGKTTLVNVITGFQKVDAGRVAIDGRDITGRPPSARCAAGIARTFQAARLFDRMSVLENVELAALVAMSDRRAARERAAELLDWVGLGGSGQLLADQLPHGDKRLAGVARALAASPLFLLMDEPAAGLNESEAQDLMEVIGRVRERFDCGVLLIEHNVPLIMAVSDRVHVLSEGRSLFEGTPREVGGSTAVRHAYLGAGAVAAETPASGTMPPATAPAPRKSLLEVDALGVRYGTVEAVRNATIQVEEGECVAIVGPNGAGKSSLLHAIAGVVRPAAGAIRLNGAALARCTIETMVGQGVSLVPEGRHVFASLTVLENLQAGATRRTDAAAARRDVEALMDDFPALRERATIPAGRLSGGEQQQLAIARALVAKPRLLLLDEPSLGLAPLVIDTVYDMLRRIHAAGMSILLVEQDAARALGFARRAYVLRSGSVVMAGASADLARDPGFEHAYFGFDGVEAAAS